MCNFECLKGSPKAFTEYLSHFSLAMHMPELAVSVNLVQLCRLAGQNLSEHHIYFPLSFCSTALACLCLKTENIRYNSSLNWTTRSSGRVVRDRKTFIEMMGDELCPPFVRLNAPAEHGTG